MVTKKLVWPANKADLGVSYQLLCTNLEDGILCTLLPNHNIHGCLLYALKPKSVLETHFRANSKKTQSLGKNGCRQKYLDKSLLQNIFRKDLLKITHRNKTQLEKDLKLLEKILNIPEELDNFKIINNNETSGNDSLTK